GIAGIISQNGLMESWSVLFRRAGRCPGRSTAPCHCPFPLRRSCSRSCRRPGARPGPLLPHRSTPNGTRRPRPSCPAALSLALIALATGCATGGAAAPSATAALAAQQAESPGGGWGQHTARMERRDGFIPLWIAPDGSKLHLELPADSMRALMHVKQATGLGSNPIGIDRGATAGAQVVRFRRVGDRMLVIFENWRYRSSNPDTLHQRSIREAFPQSTVASLPILASRDGRALVDVTEFVMRDWANVTRTLARTQQGNYSVARDR